MIADQTQQVLGKYTILRELGRGGFATVYLAQDTGLRRAESRAERKIAF